MSGLLVLHSSFLLLDEEGVTRDSINNPIGMLALAAARPRYCLHFIDMATVVVDLAISFGVSLSLWLFIANIQVSIRPIYDWWLVWGRFQN